MSILSAMRPRSIGSTLRTIPSGDTAFREHALGVHRRHAPVRPADLEAILRRMFPRVVVVERQLSGERPTWYVYRDGRWAPPSAISWWTDPDMPCISVGLDGWIVEANPAARALLNMPAPDARRRHFTDFIVPGTLEDAEALHQVLIQGHDLAATILLRPTDGEVLACDVRAQRVGDVVTSVFRLAEDIVVRDKPLATTIELRSHPESDVAFRRHAELLLSRMPEPTPEGLVRRHRRLYVHARVEPLDGR